MLTDEQILHPLNESLLKEASEIKEDRKSLRGRLEKLEETRNEVSETVYKKVHADYLAKLNKTTERLLALKKSLENEEKILNEKKRLVEQNIGYRKESMEESQLRHALGEYTSEQHQEVIDRETQELNRLQNVLKDLEDGLQHHREIFEGEDLPREEIRPKVTMPVQEVRAEPKPPAESTAKISVAPERIQERAEVIVLENGKVIQTVPLDKTIVIGRSPSNDIVLKEPKVSRKHAEIQYAAGKYIILDLESSNGTFVGGKKVSEHTLQPNDEITIGNTKMVFKT